MRNTATASTRIGRSRWLIFILIALGGLALRLPQLGARPMHTDEAVSAYIVGQVLAGEPFTYDPRDRHGPALAALAVPLARIQGAKRFSDLTESSLRLTPVVAGTITILLFGAAVELFGFVPCVIAALLFAGAPLPVYYDRYFIHESLFCTATFGLILAGAQACKANSVGKAALAGACAAIMLAAKETAIVHWMALAVAAFLFWLWNLRRQAPGTRFRSKLVLSAAGAFLFLSLLLFTWFGSNSRAPAGLLQGIPSLLARAGGQGHEKPVWYFAQLLTGGWSGGLLVALACIGFLLTLRKCAAAFWNLLAYYALGIAAMYSLIPYKTPWLALNLWLPLALFAGLAIEALWRAAARRLTLRSAIPALGIFAVLAFALIAHDTRERVFAHPADEANPYAYAHTSEDVLGLPAEIEELSRQNALKTPRIAVIAADPWPLPWYLRHFSEVGFWQPGQQAGDADFYITSTEAAEQYKDKLRNFRPEFFGVRPGVLILLWSPAPK